MRFSDRAIAALWRGYQSARAETPEAVLDHERVLDVLAAVGDAPGRTVREVRDELARAADPADVLGRVREGMTGGERRDVLAMLDGDAPGGGVMLSGADRALLERLLGRRPSEGRGVTVRDLSVDLAERGAFAGYAPAGSFIEAINLSFRAADMRIDHEDVLTLGMADRTGHYRGEMTAVRVGDVVRLRARQPGKEAGPWLTVRAPAPRAKDVDTPRVWLQRLSLVASPGGRVRLLPANARGIVAEPGALVRFTHERTGATRDVRIGPSGELPAEMTLRGKLGDRFTVAASDGVNNRDFATIEGSVRVTTDEDGRYAPFEMPAPTDEHRTRQGTPRVTAQDFAEAPRSIDGMRSDDTDQGEVGDCFLLAVLSSTAEVRPEWLDGLFGESDQGEDLVRFYRYEPRTQGYAPVAVPLPRTAWTNADGSFTYASPRQRDAQGRPEMWGPEVELAYAAWKGGFQNVASGDWPERTFEALFGVETRYTRMRPDMDDIVWARLQRAFKERRPCVATTHPKLRKAGMVPDHAYAVLGVREVNGRRLVTVRNPWGKTEPRGDKKNDGRFEIPVEVFVRDFTNLTEVVLPKRG